MNGVLITRPEPAASETAARVVALGLRPIIAPVVAIHGSIPRPSIPRSVQAIILTSRNALPALPPTCHHLCLFAVGDATAALAEQAGFSHVVSAGGDALALAETVSTAIRPEAGSLFLPTGLGQGNKLAADLRQRGFRVIRHVVYHAKAVANLPIEAEDSLKLHQASVIMFFSADTARHFVRLLRQADMQDAVKNVEAVSISRPSSMPLRQLTWRRISVALQPTQDAMLALLT